MLNKENLRKWVDALRSGEYKQGVGLLHRTKTVDGKDKFCCLGVACVVAMQNGVELTTKELAGDSPSYPGHRIQYDETYTTLPYKVREWFGFTVLTAGVRNPEFEINYPVVGKVGFAYLNDDLDLSFNQIADLIEEQLLSDEDE